MICPAQTEREIGLAALENLVERALEKLLAVAEPIMVIAKTLYYGFSCKLRLLLTHFGKTQIIES